MDVLFLSHCVPSPPDKGERIRAWNELRYLAARHRVHLACFARDGREIEAASSLRSICASVFVRPLGRARPWAAALAGFAAGRSLSDGWYACPELARHVDSLAKSGVAAALVYTVPMARYVPRGLPFVLDMADVDSEKWFEYSRLRRPACVFRAEARRFRALEVRAARAARSLVLTTEAEARVFASFAPGIPAGVVGNGVDFEYFDPAVACSPPFRSRYLLFAGSMDYYPNAEAAQWFAGVVFPELRRRDPALEFVIAGRSPTPAVRRLAAVPGIRVTGTVPDIRPYLGAAAATVVPLRIARGMQNKVLESLAMGKTVFASEAVCRTFGAGRPEGVRCCGSVADWVESLSSCPLPPDSFVRDAARRLFSWDVLMAGLGSRLDAAARGEPFALPALMKNAPADDK